MRNCKVKLRYLVDNNYSLTQKRQPLIIDYFLTIISLVKQTLLMMTQVASDLYIFTSQRHVALVTAGWWLSQDLGLGPTLNSDNTGSAQPLAPAPTSAVTVMKTPALVTLQSSSEVSHFSDCDCSVGSTSANVEDIGRDFQCGTTGWDFNMRSTWSRTQNGVNATFRF